MNLIESFCDIYFKRLAKQKVKYAVVGNYETLPRHVDNDIDIWVSDYAVSRRILLETFYELGVSITCDNKTSNGCNLYGLKLDTKEFLHVDLLTETAWKSFLTIVDSNTFRNNIDVYKGINIANKVVENAGHLLYPVLNDGELKGKYKDKLKEYYYKRNNVEELRKLYGDKIVDMILPCLFENANVNRNLLVKEFILLRLRENPVFIVSNFLRFITNNIKRQFTKNGLCIAFVGNDGCGKSTIVERLKLDSKRMYNHNNSHYGYWRPFMLPKIKKALNISDNNDDDTFVDEVRRYNLIKSYSKFAYYTIDYIFGSVKDRFNKSRGGIVVYDRYYDDLMVYPERFGMTLNRFVTKSVRNIIPQPDLVIYLSAPVEVLKERRFEIFEKEMERQVSEYCKLETDYSNYISIDGTQKLDNVYDDVIKEILSHGKRK